MEDVKYSLFTPNIQLGEEDMQAHQRMQETPNYGSSGYKEWEHQFLDALQELVSAQHDSTCAVENMNHEMENAIRQMCYDMEDAGKKMSHRLGDMEVQVEAYHWLCGNWNPTP